MHSQLAGVNTQSIRTKPTTKQMFLKYGPGRRV
jgi:hypothetical protein